MTKDQYESWKNHQPHPPLELWYEYWKELKPPHYKDITFEKFVEDFTSYMSFTQPVMTPRGVTMFRYDKALETLIEYFDGKFAGTNTAASS